jgi:hypothetical protein
VARPVTTYPAPPADRVASTRCDPPGSPAYTFAEPDVIATDHPVAAVLGAYTGAEVV